MPNLQTCEVKHSYQTLSSFKEHAVSSTVLFLHGLTMYLPFNCLPPKIYTYEKVSKPYKIVGRTFATNRPLGAYTCTVFLYELGHCTGCTDQITLLSCSNGNAKFCRHFDSLISYPPRGCKGCTAISRVCRAGATCVGRQ